MIQYEIGIRGLSPITNALSALQREAAALRWLADLDRRGVGLCQPNEKRAAEREVDARLLEQRAAQTRRLSWK